MSCPSKQHAVHIAELRKSLESDPAPILRAYDKAKESSGSHSSALVYSDSVTVTAIGNTAHMKSEAERQEDESVIDFDDLNTIETDQKDADADISDNHQHTHDTGPRTGNSGGGGGGLSGILGLGFGQGNKEDKFRVP